MRKLAIVIALATSFVAVPRARACGFWSMTDHEKHLTIGWLINSASIEHDKHRLAALYLDLENPSGIRVAEGHTVVFDLKGDAVRRRGVVIGHLTKDGVTFGKRAYTIALADPKLTDNMRSWTLAVTRGKDVILESPSASSLCAGLKKGMTEAESEDEVRRRVIYYLAWREVGL